MIIRIEDHPTDPDVLVAHTPPDLAHAMGRFAAARFSTKLRAYLIRADLLDQLRTFARHNGATVLDERGKPSEEKFTGPLPECRSCGFPASRKAALTINRCGNCGDAWHPVIYDGPEYSTQRVECPSCRHRQQAGLKFCTDCGAVMPPPEPAGGHRAIDLPDRPANQDPMPFAQCIDELDLDHNEEPERERYP